ncbi:hypothetical protein QBC35DRAFT_501135 [Podospora australis]|uniref:C2H2-type domain-containing protein n=1 Tax=Podospora australis TaxID=1536484 RepID=A0AAN6WUJ3_9PEZI|nr:hypothetical protein QBC35DRAFT_501135 [Podospora australis]
MSFLYHVSRCIEGTSPGPYVEKLSPVLMKLIAVRDLEHDRQPEDIPASFVERFKPFDQGDNLHLSFAYLASCFARVRLGIMSETELLARESSDPSGNLQALSRFRALLEKNLCEHDSHQEKCIRRILIVLYGPRLYYCDKPFCESFTRGFETARIRDDHVKLHSRSYKCHESNCPFVSIGFRTESKLNKHTAKAYATMQILSTHQSVGSWWGAMLPEDKYLVLEDVVMHILTLSITAYNSPTSSSPYSPGR